MVRVLELYLQWNQMSFHQLAYTNLDTHLSVRKTPHYTKLSKFVIRFSHVTYINLTGMFSLDFSVISKRNRIVFR